MANEISGPLAEWLADRVPKLASQAHRRFPMVPAEDFEQEIWVRALIRGPKLARDLREGNEAYVWNELRSATTRVGKEDDRFRRAQKAAAAGYKNWDEEFYSTGMLTQILPALISAEGDPAVAVYAATKGTDAAGIFIHADDPGAFGNYAVMLIDVAAALAAIKAGNRKLLEKYYGLPEEDTDTGRWERRQLASSMGITYENLRQRVHYALKELQAELGGEDPWRKQDREVA